MNMSKPTVELDLRGLLCPMTFVKLRMALDKCDAGTRVLVLYDASPGNATVPQSVKALGHIITDQREQDELDQKPLVLMHIQVQANT